MAAALATRRPFVKLSGSISSTTVIQGQQQLTILAEPGAQLRPVGEAVPLTVRDTGTRVAIFDLTITGGRGPVGVGISVPASAGMPTIELTRVTVSNNALDGIRLEGGTLSMCESIAANNGNSGIFVKNTTTVLVGSTVSDNAGLFGFVTDRSTVTVDRSTFARNGDAISTGDTILVVDRSIFADNVFRGIAIGPGSPATTVRRSLFIHNAGGGMQVRGSLLDISNNIIVRNGTTDGVVGGLALEPISGKVEHNTIVDNVAPRITGRTEAGGVDCAAAGFRLDHNLIFRNQGGEFGTVQIAGTCDFSGSLLLSAASSIDNTPGFVSPNTEPFDYHLTAATPTTIRNAAGACTGTDFDGDARPQEGACDVGADELVP